MRIHEALLTFLMLSSQLVAEGHLAPLLRVMGLARESQVISISALESRLKETLVKQNVRCDSPQPCPALWSTKSRSMVIRLFQTANDRYRVAGGDFDVPGRSKSALNEVAEVVGVAAGLSTDAVEELLAQLSEKGRAGISIPRGMNSAQGWLEMEALKAPRHTLRVHFEFE